jgi:hypothetical protein
VKKTLILLILTGITFLGCSENFDNPLLSPTLESDNYTNSKIILSDTENLTNPRLERDPDGARTGDLTDLQKLSVSKSINGVTGGELIIDTTYVNYQGRLLYVYAEIFVQQNTFQGETEFTMILHPEEATIEFYPHMVFDNVVRVSVWYEGIDLEALGYNSNGHVDFAFFANDGDIEIIPAQQSHVNMEQNTIKVLNAQLHHFSRYGWIR